MSVRRLAVRPPVHPSVRPSVSYAFRLWLSTLTWTANSARDRKSRSGPFLALSDIFQIHQRAIRALFGLVSLPAHAQRTSSGRRRGPVAEITQAERFTTFPDHLIHRLSRSLGYRQEHIGRSYRPMVRLRLRRRLR